MTRFVTGKSAEHSPEQFRETMDIKQFAGQWRIVEMAVWNQDYVDMEIPGSIRIDSEGTGWFQFGLVSGGY